MNRFVPITRKVNTIILLSLVLGIGGISYYFSTTVVSIIDTTTEESLIETSSILFRSIENIMMAGRATDAQNLFVSLRQLGSEYDIALYRTDGNSAFSDSLTILDVNQRIEKAMFDPEAERIGFPGDLSESEFQLATGGIPRTVFFAQEEEASDMMDLNRRRYVRIYKPLINIPDCVSCHGADHTVRGIVDIRANVTDSYLQRRNTATIAGGLFLGVVVFLTLLLGQFLRTTVIKPVKIVGRVCTSVTGGDFGSRVNIRNKDEIGTLGDTVNQMVEGLRERFELSKFVSSSTLRSLQDSGASSGRKVPLTVFFSDIRGFTSYTEQNPAENVVKNLNGVLNSQSRIINEHGGDIDKYVGDEIVAMFSEDDPDYKACVSAVKIQRHMEAASAERYDGLSVGIGINTGEVILGMIGSDQRADFTFIGDNVNTASRLCDKAKPGQILISESTYLRAKDRIEADGPYKLRVKGKDLYLKVYILIDVSGAAQ